MSRSRSGSETPTIWAIPVSREMVALWSELPRAACDVAIAPVAAATEPCFRRRLITAGRRLHLTVLRATDFKASKPCVVTHRPERGRPTTAFEALPRLADWSTPAVAAVLQAIVEGLSELGTAEDTRQLARFLNLVSSWAVPCRFHGTEAGLNAAVFEFAPSTYGPLTAFAVEDGAVVSRQVMAVEHDTDSACLLWRGNRFDRAYLGLDGELLELKLDFRRGARPKPLGSWFADLAPAQQDAILDGWRVTGRPDDPENGSRFGAELPTSRAFRRGQIKVMVDGLFAIGRSVYLIADATADAELDFRVWTPGAGDADLGQPNPVGSSGNADHRRSMVCRADVGSGIEDASPACVTLGRGDAATSHWIAVQGLENRRARQRLRGLIDWDAADNHLVGTFAAAVVAAGSRSVESMPAVVTLCAGSGAIDDGPLMICHFGGDLEGLRATLLAMRLTWGDEATIRLVRRGRLISTETRSLQALCQSFAMRVDLVAIDDQAPLSDALIRRPGDRRHRAILYAESGMVPLDRDWWPRLAAAMDRDAEALHVVQPLGQTDRHRSVLAMVSGASPVVVAGPGVIEQILAPAVELQTFEGFLHHALAMAERVGRLAHLENLRFDRFSRAEAPAAWFGAARLDDVVISSLLGTLPRDVEDPRRDNLVILGARASGS